MVIERKGIRSNEIVVIGRCVEEYYFMLVLIVTTQYFFREARARKEKITYKGILQKVQQEWGELWTAPDYWKTHKPKQK